MKAAVYRSYGPPEVLRIEEVAPPSIREEEEDVLVKVHSASVNLYDCLIRSGYLPTRFESGLFKPKRHILGIDVAGTVAAVGKKGGRFKVGDRVFGSCRGSHAEYVRCRASAISLLPAHAGFQQAAAVPTAALTALQALRDLACIRPGQKVLIYGASGGVGHFAVQLARYFEADVTAVCSAANFGWVEELGAHQMIDYTREDFTHNGQRYDIIYICAAKVTYFGCRDSLAKTGVYVTENPLKPKNQPGQLLLAAITGDRRARLHITNPNAKDLDLLSGWMEQGKLKAVIDTSYPLAQVVEAHRHVENGHTHGKVILEIQ